jgi:hypothetical protein|tara:strand:+ start:71 stop:463 length:393 start_codon:yes stop_codon:yes gene_type:complete
MKYLFITLLLFSSSIFSSDSKVYFVNIKDGDKVQSPFLIQFGLSGKGVAPAGVDRKNTGHHHLLINVDSIDFNISIPASDNHIHFGGGQTETVLDLLPGEYTLQLLLGDMYHVPHDPPVLSNKISLIVTD